MREIRLTNRFKRDYKSINPHSFAFQLSPSTSGCDLLRLPRPRLIKSTYQPL
jgi:hypothetical protein